MSLYSFIPLPPTISQRVVNPVKGRGLFAEKDFGKDEVILIDKPLVAIQHVKNRIFAPTCAHCFRFLGSLEYQLSHLANVCEIKVPKNFHFPKLVNLPQDQDPFFSTNIVECPGKCGEKYCSEECQMKAYNQHHQLLCVGPINDYDHPLVLFKKYAIEHNELFLLAAQLIVTIIFHYKRTGTREGTDFLAMFCHRPWWEVIITEGKPGLEADLKRLLEESLELLRAAIMLPILEQYPSANIQDLFSMEFYSHLIGALEMYDNTIEITSPLQHYLNNVQLISGKQQQEKTRELLTNLRDRLSVMQLEAEHEDVEAEDEAMGSEHEEESGDNDEMNDDDEADADEIPKFDGFGVFPTSAMSNHSCEPNCIVKYKTDNSLLLVTKRNIAKGEELTHSYVDDDLPLDERREDLREYGFLCDCPRCLREETEQKEMK